MRVLNKVNGPQDVKRLTVGQQLVLCSELRQTILKTCATNGGHLASNLGAVELTVALHHSFNSPKDSIVFDVGHQCYAHKLITGRRDEFSTLRCEGGLSGFPMSKESEHDSFGTGHSSTSVSVAAGIAAAKKIKGEEGFAIAVIGDGAMTGGLAFEGLNNAAALGKLVVILNDNDNSISSNVGFISRYLPELTSKPGYFKIKDATTNFVLKTPAVGKPLYKTISKVKGIVKDAVVKSNFFEELGFRYYGPIDGHDLKLMEDVLKRVREKGEPAFVHVKTIKGKGVAFAEKNPAKYHGVPPFDIKTGAVKKGAQSFSQVFGETLTEMAANNDNIVAVTAAMELGVGLESFKKQHKNRFFDVGIAEQHAITFAAGMASKGIIPYFAVYSTFLQRGYDQLQHDVALPNLPVVLCIDRAGLTGEDGATHQGMFDVAFLATVPNMTVYSPANFTELREVLAADVTGPTAIRYPRGTEPILPKGEKQDGFTVYGEGEKIIITYGRIVENCLGENVKVISLLKLNPVDFGEIAKHIPEGTKKVFFVEEGFKQGGLGERTAYELTKLGAVQSVEIIAADRFVEHATVKRQQEMLGLDKDSIRQVVQNG